MARPTKAIKKKTFNTSMYPSQIQFIDTICKQCNEVSRSEFVIRILEHFMHTVTWSTSDKDYPVIILRSFGNMSYWEVEETGEMVGDEFSGQFNQQEALEYAFKRFPEMIYNEFG